jgi:hypothetical protein
MSSIAGNIAYLAATDVYTRILNIITASGNNKMPATISDRAFFPRRPTGAAKQLHTLSVLNCPARPAEHRRCRPRRPTGAAMQLHTTPGSTASGGTPPAYMIRRSPALMPTRSNQPFGASSA